MYILNDKIIIKKRDSIYFGLNMETGSTLEMNESQYSIISFFSGKPKSKEELLEYLKKAYLVDEDTLKKDVDISMNVLLSENILQHV